MKLKSLYKLVCDNASGIKSLDVLPGRWFPDSIFSFICPFYVNICQLRLVGAWN